MTKQELYRDLCVEAGTYDAPEGTTSAEWYEMCSHNINPGLDADLQAAADGDVQALADCRSAIGLLILS